MNKRDREAFDHFYKAYEHQWNLNRYYRDQYDDDIDYYVGHRDEDEYPLAFNMTFPQLLPRITNMLARMLEQIYQAPTHDLVSVRPRKRADVDRAPRVAALLNCQLEGLNSIDMVGGSYMFNYEWMNNALSWGKGIAKAYWRKEERIAPLRKYIPVPAIRNGRLVGFDNQSIIIEAPQIVYDGPYAEVLHNKAFVPHPHYKSIQKMPFVFCVYRKSVDYIREMEKKGLFRNVKELGWSSQAGELGKAAGDHSYETISKGVEIEASYYDVKFSSEYIAPEVDIIEGYGRYIFPGDRTAYEVGSGVKIKGKESDAKVVMGNHRVLLSLEKWNYGYKPFFDIGCYRHPELFWDMGILRLGKSIQEQYDTLANTRYQGALMSVNPMLQVQEDSDIPPEALITKPWGIIPVPIINETVAPLVFPDANYINTFKEQEEFFRTTIEDMTGMYRYNMGSTPSRQEHVGTIYSLQAMGEARTKLLLMTMDYQGFQSLLKYFMLLNTWHLPDGFEARVSTNQGDQFMPLFAGDIHPDYDFTVRYTSMEPALGKQFRAQQLIQYAQMWAESPYLQHYEFMKAIMELLDFHASDRFLKTPQQVAQEQQQMVMQAVQKEMLDARIQDELEANKQKRELERDVTKGMLKLADTASKPKPAKSAA